MLAKRLTYRAFWRITIPVHCLRLWYVLWDKARHASLRMRHLVQPLPAPHPPRPRRRGPVFAAPDPSLVPALRLQARLLARALAGKIGQAAHLHRPQDRRFPYALGGYLLLAFALEYAFLLTFLPGPEPFAPRPGHAATREAASIDPAYSLEVGGTVADLLGSPPPGLVERMTPVDVPASLLRDGETGLLDLAEGEPSFPALPGLETPEPRAETRAHSPSMVRMAVVRYQVRMPVDPEAFHPLDKESLMAVAGRILPGVFARVEAADLSPAAPKPTALADAAPSPSRTLRSSGKPGKPGKPTGRLSARFESGLRGVYAIGYDPKGGTSYGKYQMSSRKGTVAMFIHYLDKRMPQWAERLRRAGRANTLSRAGAMPMAWRDIARGNATLFETLQDDFIHRTFYSPTVAAVARTTGLDMARRSEAVREVLLSTAVQHGPNAGARIVIAATKLAGKPTGSQYERSLLTEIFKERERCIVERALPAVRPALKRRLRDEMNLALAMLEASPKNQHLF